MLNGIGGRTIEEAKERVTHDEYVSWCAYVKKNGTLNIGMRLEMGFAMLAHVTNNTMGGKTKLEDFLPRREPEAAAALTDVFSLIQSKARGVNSGDQKSRNPDA